MAKILIVDDEAGICSSLKFALQDDYEVKTTTDPYQGLTILEEEQFNVVLLDLKLGNADGIDILEKIKTIDGDIMVIMMTAYGTIESSVEAVKKGAFTYITKPLNTEELLTHIQQALTYQNMNQELVKLKRQLQDRYSSNGILGKTSSMKKIFKLIEKVKDINTNVLITGESGTGKELVARAIHYNGVRSESRFEVVNCAAIPENLLESELFGHKKGAFTGALDDRVGKFELAHGGTIFLDEIAEMPLSLQSKLLRVLQQKEITPLGSNETKQLDVRVISATNQDVKQLLEEGKFRQDLYYRLNVVEIHLPNLRERKQDIPILINHFINKLNTELNTQIESISSEAINCLLSYDYPGNIRELENIIESSMVVAEGDVIEWYNLPEEIIDRAKGTINWQESKGLWNYIGMSIEELEIEFIKVTLKYNNGHRKETANMLGISEKGLRNKLQKYNIQD